MAASLIDFLSILHTIDTDQIAFQHEQHPQVADAHSVFLRFPCELFHISGEIALQHIETPPDVSPLLLGQYSQLLSRSLFDFQAIPHSTTFAAPAQSGKAALCLAAAAPSPPQKPAVAVESRLVAFAVSAM
jgi:hypothetical protein